MGRRTVRLGRGHLGPHTPTQADFAAQARFRHRLRRFLRFSEHLARRHGVTPAQHQLLLAVRGSRAGWLGVGAIATQLLIRHHSAVGLVDRAVRDGLVHKIIDQSDQRRVQVHLTARGRRLILLLTAAHRRRLARLWLRVPRPR